MSARDDPSEDLADPSGDEHRLAAVLAVLALARAEGTPTSDLARWRAQRLAALGAVRTPGARPAGWGS
jgi:hypothetical protein